MMEMLLMFWLSESFSEDVVISFGLTAVLAALSVC